MRNRIRPPKRRRILLSTSASAIRCCTASKGPTCRAASRELRGRPPHSDRPGEQPGLDTALGGNCGHDPGISLLEHTRGRAHERRADLHHVVDDLVDPAVDRGGKADSELRGEQHLAEGVGQRQPQQLHVVGAQQVKRDDRAGLVRPRRMRQPHTLRTPGRPGRVHERRQTLGTDPGDPIGHDGRLSGEQRQAAPLQLGKTQHPIAFVVGGLAVDEHHPVDPVDVPQLRGLAAVLGHHDTALRVSQDVLDIDGHRARVDGRRRGARAHHRQVDEDPLVPGAGHDRDPITGADAQRDETRSLAHDPFTRGAPGDRRPPTLGAGIPVRLRRRGPSDPLGHEPRDGGGAIAGPHSLADALLHTAHPSEDRPLGDRWIRVGRPQKGTRRHQDLDQPRQLSVQGTAARGLHQQCCTGMRHQRLRPGSPPSGPRAAPTVFRDLRPSRIRRIWLILASRTGGDPSHGRNVRNDVWSPRQRRE